jgi:hypothetical protein
MIGDLRIVIMRLVESDPYVYRATPAEPLSARGLIQRDGVREVEFRSLPPLCEQAIRTRAAEHLDPGAQPQIKHKMRISYVGLPMEASQQAVLAAVQREGAPFQTFAEYHGWYVGHADSPSHVEMWPT